MHIKSTQELDMKMNITYIIANLLFRSFNLFTDLLVYVVVFRSLVVRTAVYSVHSPSMYCTDWVSNNKDHW